MLLLNRVARLSSSCTPLKATVTHLTHSDTNRSLWSSHSRLRNTAALSSRSCVSSIDNIKGTRRDLVRSAISKSSASCTVEEQEQALEASKSFGKLRAMSGISYLSQSQAVAIDEELMGPLGFSVDQLMELAGLSVACSVAEEYPHAKAPTVLVLAGPGNNGGDGLVAARHLHHFGYKVELCYPKPTEKPLYNGLVTQCKSLGLPFKQWDEITMSEYDVVIDALFGFSFKGAPRPPFDNILKALLPSASPPPIVSVDIPSGWDVENGDVDGECMQPAMLVSLTAPKMGSRSFKGIHYLGGRFVPPAIAEKYSLSLPQYTGSSMCVKIATEEKKVADMRISYELGGLMEGDVNHCDPMATWDAWFKQATNEQVCQEPNAISLATADAEGRPSVRVVLLKGYDERGFIFYTNYDSRKGQDLKSGYASFSVYWEKLQRQVRVEGTVEKVPEEESTAYYHSRPRGSQIGAWVSKQSQPLPNGRAELEDRNEELQKQYADESQPVPKPPHWGGYLIRPTKIEFWQGRPSRLHDRIACSRESVTAPWSLDRLQP